MTRWKAIAGLCGLALACGRTGVLEDDGLPDRQHDAGAPDGRVDAGIRIAELTELRACMYFGGLDRLRIYVESADPPGCAWMQFTSPPDEYVHHVDIAETWGLTFIGFLPASPCPQSSVQVPWSAPTEVEGAVQFVDIEPRGGYPRTLSVDVLARFDADARTPAEVRFRSQRLAITEQCLAP